MTVVIRFRVYAIFLACLAKKLVDFEIYISG